MADDTNILPNDQNSIRAAGFESSSTPGLVMAGQIDEITGRILVDNAGGGGAATEITVTNEATDTTCFLVFVTAATGDLEPKSNAGLTFNSNTARLNSTILASSSLTASEIVITDANKNLVSAAVATYPSLTELTYLKGVTSAIQTQLNAKAAALSGTANEIAYFNTTTTIASLTTATYPSLTELSYVKGVTSALQTQLNAKGAISGQVWTGAHDFGGADSLEVPNGAGGTTVNAAGEVCVDTTSDTLNFYDGTVEAVLNPVQSKSITIESPTAAEDLSMWYTDDAITITKIVFVITGSTSATTTIRFGSDRSATGTEVVTGGTTANSTTTGNVVTSFNDATIPADNFIWLETTALSGTPTSLSVTIFYRQDA